jgi:hypothetical protein
VISPDTDNVAPLLTEIVPPVPVKVIELGDALSGTVIV